MDTFESFNKNKLTQLLHLTTKEPHIQFNEALYKQVMGLAIRSPLGPPLANAF